MLRCLLVAQPVILPAVGKRVRLPTPVDLEVLRRHRIRSGGWSRIAGGLADGLNKRSCAERSAFRIKKPTG